MIIVDIFGRDDLIGDINACILPAFLAVDDFAELMHINLRVIANGEAVVNAQHFMPKYAFPSAGRGLVLIEMFFRLLADLYLADLVIVVEQLIGYIACVHHELQLGSDCLAGQKIDVVRFDLEHQQDQ